MLGPKQTVSINILEDGTYTVNGQPAKSLKEVRQLINGYVSNSGVDIGETVAVMQQTFKDAGQLNVLSFDSDARLNELKEIWRECGGTKTTIVKHNPQKKRMVVIIDGEKSDEGTLSRMSPDEIRSIEVFKDKESLAKYGVEDGVGVVIVTSKEEVAFAVKVKGSSGKSLVFIDGIESSSDEMNKISHDDIASIEVLKGEKATDKYGERANDGVILITTKKR